MLSGGTGLRRVSKAFSGPEWDVLDWRPSWCDQRRVYPLLTRFSGFFFWALPPSVSEPMFYDETLWKKERFLILYPGKLQGTPHASSITRASKDSFIIPKVERGCISPGGGESWAHGVKRVKPAVYLPLASRWEEILLNWFCSLRFFFSFGSRFHDCIDTCEM